MGRIGLRSPPPPPAGAGAGPTPMGGRSVVSVCDNLANFGGRTSQLRPSTIAVFVSLIVQVCRGEIFLVQSWGQFKTSGVKYPYFFGHTGISLQHTVRIRRRSLVPARSSKTVSKEPRLVPDEDLY